MERATSIKKFKFLKLTTCFWLALILSGFNEAAIAASIGGRVSDKITSKPIAGVIVGIAGQSGPVALTDSSGFYRIDQLPAGKITLVFSAANYRQQTVTLALTEMAVAHLDAALENLQVNLGEVVISAKINPRSDLQSRLTEKNTIPTVDIVSGNLIEHSGSISAGDAVQHIPGLSVTYTSTGNSDKAIIRGMEAKYSYTLINGFKIPSPDDKSRYISLDIFPAALLQSVQVYKSLTADMEGDAIGGATNLVMRDPPDDPLLQISLNTGYSTRYFNNAYRTFDSHAVQDRSPYERFGPGYYATGADFTRDNLSFYNSQPSPDITASIVAGRRFFGNKLGFIAAADYKNIKTGSDGFFIPLNSQPNLNNVPAFSDYHQQSYNNNKIALSISTEIVYRPDSANRLMLSHFFVHQTDAETRSTVDTSLVLGRSGAGTGRIYLSDRSRVHQQQLNNLNLKGSHSYNNLEIDWAGVYSAADGSYPDWAELTANTGRLLSPNGTITKTPLLLAPLTRIWLRNQEKDEDAYLDLHDRPALFKQKLTLSGGALIRHKTRDNFYNSYVFSPQINEPFTNIYDAVWVNNNGPQNPLGNVNNPNTYTATEQINAYYLMASLLAGRSEFTGGIRAEQTAQHFVSALDPTVSYGQTVGISYKDWLPDLHWKYSVNDDQQLKASYFKAISRPALYDITFATIAYEDYNVAGNPFLKRTQADNFDLNYTWLKTNGNRLKMSLFYKHIIDAYEKTLINGNDELYPIPQNGLSYTPAGVLTEQLKNTGTATNYGAELLYSFNWRNFSVTCNYTYTSSSITRMKKFITRVNPDDPSSNIVTITKPEEGPLAGQSKNLANINLLYNNKPGNWLANLSVVYTGKRIDLVSPWYGLDYWQRSNITLNLSAEKKLGNHFKISASAINLLNSGVTDDILTPNPNGIGNNDLPGQTQRDKITILKQNFSAYCTLGLHYQM
ncbi:TonB-dependent receptor domain-containing protein [Mucilaginibacter sp. McL0603]|uniref:TonB-dependent receptor domain-containing protein n=1 Tax=Mucilaginibacter sp. McL0603 TaxID=3415670 RepID=UPI003CF6EF1E